MQIAGFNLTMPNVSEVTNVRVSFYVIDAEQGGMYIPTQLNFGEIDLHELITCRCVDCITVAILTWSLQRMGENACCRDIKHTYDEMSEWVQNRTPRVEVPVVKP